MAKGNHNARGRGGFRGSPRGDQFRGRGRGGRGRGRGQGLGAGGGGIGYADEFDFPIQMWPENASPSRGFSSPRARGRGGANNFGPSRDSPTPRRGRDTPRGRGRGRGRGDASPYEDMRGRGRGGRGGRGNLTSRLRAGVPLSKLLDEDRPLLKPIIFVRSVHTATLFRQEEDILQPLSEPVANDENGHVPTADRVTQVFSGVRTETADEDSSSDDEEQLEEVDFADIGKVQAEVNVIATTLQPETAPTETAPAVADEEQFSGFFVDTTPTPITSHVTNPIIPDRLEGVLGEQSQEDDEIIVYVAPHPRTGRAPAPAVEDVATGIVEIVPSTSIITGVEISEERLVDVDGTEPSSVADAPIELESSVPSPPAFESIQFAFDHTPRKKQTRKIFPVGGPRSLLKRLKKVRRKSLRSFSAYGAIMSEAHVQNEGKEKDPRESEQRRGDSDVNWGDSSSDEDGERAGAMDELSSGIGAMDIDDDADVTLEAMQNFVKSMSAEGSRHVTMDDVADIERMRLEDAEEDEQGSADAGDEDETESDNEDEDEDEVEHAFNAEERFLVGEEEADTDEDEDSSDDEATPRTVFQSKLLKLRTKAKGKVKAQQEDSSDEAMSVQMTWRDKDDEFLAEIEDIVNQNSHILNSRDRKAQTKLFHAISDGDFDHDVPDNVMPTPRKKNKHVPPELQDQWDKDRAKKAENKRKRAEAKLAIAADPLAVHKGGKKGRKAMLAAARLNGYVDLPNRVTDLVTLEQQIRRFLADIGGRSSMALPPADKETRAKIHELADAFNLKSQSKGSGVGRYTTLIKTSKSGVGINEKKVRRIVKISNKSWDPPGGGKGKKSSLAMHQEGEEIGTAAPKIGESNVGFKMLAAMGWAEGDLIGLSGGLEAPLTAVMKKTKLGVGATLENQFPSSSPV